LIEKIEDNENKIREINLKHESSIFLVDLESSSFENSWLKDDKALKKKISKESNTKKNLKIGSKILLKRTRRTLLRRG